MNSPYGLIAIVTIVLLIGSNARAQQAWTQKGGEGYFQVGSSVFYYSTAADDDYKSFDLARPITEVILSLYAEYGITNKLTGSIVVPIHFVSSSELNSEWLGFAPEEGSLTSLGNLNLALTYRIYAKNDFVLSSKLTSSINTSDYKAANGLRTGYDAFGISPTILAGIGSDVFFASAETGLNILSGAYLNRFIFNAQIGKELTNNKRLIGVFVFTSSTSLGNSSNEQNLKLNGTSSLTALYQNERTYYAGIFKLGYKLSDYWGLWLAIGGGYAKNIGRNPVYSLAFAYNLR